MGVCMTIMMASVQCTIHDIDSVGGIHPSPSPNRVKIYEEIKVSKKTPPTCYMNKNDNMFELLDNINANYQK